MKREEIEQLFSLIKRASDIREACLLGKSCNTCQKLEDCREIFPHEVPGEMTKREALDFLKWREIDKCTE